MSTGNIIGWCMLLVIPFVPWKLIRDLVSPSGPIAKRHGTYTAIRDALCSFPADLQRGFRD